MKKLFPMLILALTVLLTACNNDEPNNESTSMVIVYSRAVNPDDNTTTFSQATCQFVLRNEATTTLQAQLLLKLNESTTVEFTTQFMPLTPCSDESYTYTFASTAITSASGGHTISNLRGKINMVGPTYIEYTVDGNIHCYSTLQPYYTHTVTQITRTENDSPVDYTLQKSHYGLMLDNAGSKGDLYLFNFQFSETGSTIYCLRFDGLNAEPTATGYHLTGADIVPKTFESSYDTNGNSSEQYKIQSLDLNITDQGQTVSGTIITADETAPITINLNGRFFETNI